MPLIDHTSKFQGATKKFRKFPKTPFFLGHNFRVTRSAVALTDIIQVSTIFLISHQTIIIDPSKIMGVAHYFPTYLQYLLQRLLYIRRWLGYGPRQRCSSGRQLCSQESQRGQLARHVSSLRHTLGARVSVRGARANRGPQLLYTVPRFYWLGFRVAVAMEK